MFLISLWAGGHDDAESTPIHTRLLYPIDPTSPPYTTHIHNEVFLDLDSESSSDNGYHPHNHDYLELGGTAGGGERPEEDNLDTVYPFAWALDGRRIGENGVAATGRAESPNSITAPLSVVSLFPTAFGSMACLYVLVLIILQSVWVDSDRGIS